MNLNPYASPAQVEEHESFQAGWRKGFDVGRTLGFSAGLLFGAIFFAFGTTLAWCIALVQW